MTPEARADARHLVFIRSGGRCESCGKYIVEQSGLWVSMHLHHIKTRGAGGDDSLSNLKGLCIDCHLVGSHHPKSVPSKETP